MSEDLFTVLHGTTMTLLHLEPNKYTVTFWSLRGEVTLRSSNIDDFICAIKDYRKGLAS